MKEYGRKPYLSKTYYEMMRRPTKKHLQNVRPQHESEFEKPYLADEYQEMQHFAPKAGGPWDWPGMPEIPAPSIPGFPDAPPKPPVSGWWPGPGSGPGPPGPGPGQGVGDWWPEYNQPCYPFVKCDGPRETDASGCATVCIRGFCGSNWKTELYAWTDDIENWSLSGGNLAQAPITGQGAGATWGSGKYCVRICYKGTENNVTAYIEFTDLDYDPDGNFTKLCSIVGTGCDCDTTTDISYDSGNPATIGQSSEVSISVNDGCGPFDWSVSGTGFSFANATTTGRGNTLQTDGTACGPGEITVTDDCSDTATGTVRCTTGEWTVKETGYACGFDAGCSFYQAAAEADCAITAEIVSGKQKWEFDGAEGTCAYRDNGCTATADWDLQIGGGPCNDPPTYPPSCDPFGCNDGTCDGFWGELEVACVYRKYVYSEWECAA